MKMTKEHKALRRKHGIAKFERECRTVLFSGRWQKAYRVPGTSEHGKFSMNKAFCELVARSDGFALCE